MSLPVGLVEEVSSLAPDPRSRNFNRLVITALEEYAKRRKAAQFEESMARMAADPAIRDECAAIAKGFAGADADGLNDD